MLPSSRTTFACSAAASSPTQARKPLALRAASSSLTPPSVLATASVGSMPSSLRSIMAMTRSGSKSSKNRMTTMKLLSMRVRSSMELRRRVLAGASDSALRSLTRSHLTVRSEHSLASDSALRSLTAMGGNGRQWDCNGRQCFRN
eukprot:9318092-Lingulodinium_polyedra.AAC.1